MSDDATASLKGMLGLKKKESTGDKTTGSEKKRGEGDKRPTRPKGPKPTNKTTPPKPRKSNDSYPNPTSGKTTRGKRGGGKKNNTGENSNNNATKEEVVKPNGTAANGGKKKKNKKRDSQGENEADGTTKTTPQLKNAKQHNSAKHNANNYAWSAFQNSPDPSALPDIGGLFLGGAANDEAKDSNEGVGAKEGADLGSSVNSSLNLGPPSDHIRTSLVSTMLNQTDGVNAGEALLKSLTSPTRQSFSNPMPPVNERFRTAESLEAEMLSPSLKPDEKVDNDDSNLPKLDLTDAVENEKVDTEKKVNEEKRDDTERPAETTEPQTKSNSPNPAEQPTPPSMKKQYPDAITQLMNPGFGGAGYGMHPHMPHHPQHMPYHFPLHHGPPPPGPGYHGHHYPVPHHPPPYHPMPPNARPGFTTVNVRVPPSLLPGNTMIVEGMQIQVPPGVPPGAVIPVNIPVPTPQHYYGHPHPPPPNYHGAYPPHMHPGSPMMPPRQHMAPPPPPHQQHPSQAPNNPPQTNSWASKVASGPPSESQEVKSKEITAKDSKPKDPKD